MTRVVPGLMLWVAAAGCAATPGPPGAMFSSPDAPIPLRAGYWLSPRFEDARFTGGLVGDAAFGDVMREGLIDLARSTFRASAQFESREMALASPTVDVVVAPTIESLSVAKDPEGLGARDLSTVRMRWHVSDKAGAVLWSNVVVTQLRETCLVALCREQFAKRALKEHFQAAGAEMRSVPWWQRGR
jgi:hypothetical protein